MSKVSSFEVVALPFGKVLYARAFRLTCNKEDAEDLVQITYLRAYQYWNKFKAGTNCGAWLNTILRNSFINMYRKEILSDLNVITYLWREDDIICADLLVDKVRTPEQEFICKMVSKRVGEIIKEMPYTLRQVTFLRVIEDYSYERIMNAMGLTLGTVKSRLYKGRKLLQERLEYLNESRKG